MKRLLLIILVGLLMLATQTYALEVTALVPTRGAPGALVAVYGGPFTTQTRLFLGELYVLPRVILQNLMEFTIPEILTVERGEDQVNHYQVIIRGRNFHFNSTLVVNEPEDSTIGRTLQQLSFDSRVNVLGRDIFTQKMTRLDYDDCQTLIYHRYPTSFQDKDLSLQIEGPYSGTGVHRRR